MLWNIVGWGFLSISIDETVLWGKKEKLPSCDLIVVRRYAWDWVVLILNLSLLYISVSSNNSMGDMHFAFGWELRPKTIVLVTPMIACRNFSGAMLSDTMYGPFLIVVISLLAGFCVSIVMVMDGVDIISLFVALLGFYGMITCTLCLVFFY